MANKKKAQKTGGGLKKYTVEMYDKTLSEMKERGASAEEIKMVEDAKADAIAALERTAEPVKPYVKPESKGTVTVGGKNINVYVRRHKELEELSQTFVPLFKNLFILRIGELPVYLVRFYYDRSKDQTICISTIEAKDFSPEVYFSENEKFKTLTVEYYSSIGETLRVDTYEGVKVKAIKCGDRNYSDGDKPIETFIELKYKKKNVSTAYEKKWPVSKTEVKDS